MLRRHVPINWYLKPTDKFRACEKEDNQTCVEFACKKGVFFDKWYQASKVQDLSKLRELVLLEDFKTCPPEHIVTYLNEKKDVGLSRFLIICTVVLTFFRKGC